MSLGELVPTGGGDPIPLLKSSLLVGRRDSCDIALRFPNVSSHHCQLDLVNGYWRVRDLGSRNGTKVNGSRVDLHWLLPGDELAVAKHKYEVKYLPQSDGPPPEIEDGMSIGLLEKAGLEPRPRRTDPVRNGSAAVSPSLPAAEENEAETVSAGALPTPDSDDSLALSWLQDGD